MVIGFDCHVGKAGTLCDQWISTHIAVSHEIGSFDCASLLIMSCD